MNIIANTIYNDGVIVGILSDSITGNEFKEYLEDLEQNDINLQFNLDEKAKELDFAEEKLNNLKVEHKNNLGSIHDLVKQRIDELIYTYVENPDLLRKRPMVRYFNILRKEALEHILKIKGDVK